ncbi:hypothetical protein [Chryseobacterium sp. MEBOG07]|uniref:hypothetical protein n=1 Tax=Chryseobacterium sp. MEBOG07 TaxID=2879939 RepID=UPI001F442BA9|nr:hypothetical protein [Chryseobacterium sp. MEBOG07]UKB81268.1 hypothetical protein LF886_09835 [Chryseobacterium sp. MEBOG07]
MKNQNNSYLNLKDYFEKLVENSTFLNSFAGYFNRELLNKEANDELNEPYLAIFDYSIGLKGPEQNTISVRKLTFAIIKNNVPEDDFQLQYKAIDDSEDMVLQVLSRIRNDSQNPAHFLYNSFLKDSVSIEPVELNANSYGSVCYLEFQNNKSLQFKKESWKDIENICN